MNTQQIQSTLKNAERAAGNVWLWLGLGIVLFVAALAIQNVSRAGTIIPKTGGSSFTAQSVPEASAQGVAAYIRAHSNPSAQAVPEAGVQSVTDYLRLHSNDLSLREYILGERYGEIPQNVAPLSAEQIHREYTLGERYGVTPQQYYRNKFLDECSDVGLIYRAQCLSQSQESTP